MEQALSHLRVLDLTRHIAGPYATKLLADYGADVIKIEKPGEGDPTRRKAPFPGDIPHPEKSGLFLHLNTNKRSITLDLKSAAGQSTFKELVRGADAVIESFRPGVMASFGLDYPVLEKINPRLVMASISNFGQTGPYRDFKASDLVLAGMGGTQSGYGVAEKPPLKVANSVTQYIGGIYALSGILAALFVSRKWGIGQHLDLSLFELLVSFGDYRVVNLTRYQLTGVVETRPPAGQRSAPTGPMSLEAVRDGYVQAQWSGRWDPERPWRQLVTMLKRPDLLTDPRFATTDARRKNQEELISIVRAWMRERTRTQCWEEAVVSDYPCAPYNTIEELLQDPHLKSRGFWTEVEHPALGKTTIPGHPFILNESPWRLLRPAPLLGEHNAEIKKELDVRVKPGAARSHPKRRAAGRPPLEGIRVLDMCPMQAGNFGNLVMADLGAEVIKVESTQHWQMGVRGNSARPTKEQVQQAGAAMGYPDMDPGPHPWNVYGQILTFSRNKLSMTVDLTKPEGVQVMKRLIKVTDILIESNTAPVMPKFGLDYPQLKEVNPTIIMIRMPGYGLSGPYRDRPGMAPTMEAYLGHGLLRGYPGADPFAIRTTPANVTSDGAAGAGAAVAAIMALHFRESTGKGQLVEFAQVENFMSFLGEFYMDYIFNKRLHGPQGNRHTTAAPCGCYQCAGDDQWVDITVHNDQEWQGLCRALDNPAWTGEPELATGTGRYGNQDDMDRRISEWTRTRDKYGVMQLLQREGVPCGPVLNSRDVFTDPHLQARGHIQAVTHPEAGTRLFPAPPWKMSRTPVRIRNSAPLLGEHNEYVYKELLGYTNDEYARLEAGGQIGNEPGRHIP